MHNRLKYCSMYGIRVVRVRDLDVLLIGWLIVLSRILNSLTCLSRKCRKMSLEFGPLSK